MNDVDMHGHDLAASPVASDDVMLCEALCCNNPSCVAFVYASKAPSDFLDCVAGDHCCYQKDAIDVTVASPGLKFGTTGRSPVGPNQRAPPIGTRSAVPLGGLGAGSFELRGDGTFHEVTIHNAHPAAAAKYGVLSGALLGLRVAPKSGAAAAVTRMLRTSPPAWAASETVESLAYSGSHPVSRLSPRDAALAATGVSADLFAYSVFKPGRAADAAHPAVAFSLRIENTSPDDALVSLYFQLPWGGINDCDRVGNRSTIISQTTTPDAPACAAAAAVAKAGAYTWNAMTSNCTLTSDAPWSRYRQESTCAVTGGWRESGEAITFIADGGPGSVGSPGVGDVTLRAVSDSSSAAWSDDAAGLWSSFVSTGSVAGVAGPTTAANGAMVSSALVPAGSNATVSIIFSWHFPLKDWWHETVGNYYSTIWADSAAVAAELAEPSRLNQVVDDIAAHHSVFLGPGGDSSLPPSPLPDWLRDNLVNQFSHFRSLHFLADGRLREYEANDCPDVDSVHNDYQRHLPYIWAAPEFEISKFREYAFGQAKDGHIPEYLGSFGLGPLDNPGGRVMADTTTLWLVELYEFWINTGDRVLLDEMWPTAAAAVAWQINACSQIGLPWRLVCTYDIIDFQQYNTSAFNSFVHLASMRAASQLARVVNDTATADAADAAFTRAYSALSTYLWNSTYSYYRAYTGAEALMGDTLYGQVVALHHGLGWLAAQSDLQSHLAAELKYNGNAFGIRVVTGRHDPPPKTSRFLSATALGVDTTDDTNWQGAGPDWSYVAIQLARAAGPAHAPIDPTVLASALEPARRSLENWRSRLNDMWNVCGLTSTDDWNPADDNANGAPYITSHYGFLLVDYYLLTALSGQETNIPAGTLSFEPAYPCPYTLPLLLQGTEGLVSCSGTPASPAYTVTILFGALSLPTGGLSIAGSTYPAPVNMAAGDAVTW
jgi:non-lysosomal glucosylceramidase